VAFVYGVVPPAEYVYCDAASDPAGLRFFTVALSDAPVYVEGSESVVWCAHCLIEEFPEVGRGLDLALEYGEAERDHETGEWSVPA